jgi:ribonuclease Y
MAATLASLQFTTETLLLSLASIAVGVLGAWWLQSRLSARSLKQAREQAVQLTKAAEATATARAADVQLAAERAAANRRSEVDREVQAALQGIQDTQARSQRIQETLERKLAHMQEREEQVDARDRASALREQEVEREAAAVAEQRATVRARLGEIARLTEEQARARSP